MPAVHSTAEIREGFLSSFERNGHLRRPSASLIPRSDDRSTLLTTAGAEFFFTPRWTLLVKFDGDFAPGSQTYAGSGTLRYVW